ncbi:MAG: alpha/beta fold hydrolase [Bdellovibrionota bacterium]
MELTFKRWNTAPTQNAETTRLLLLHGMGGTGQLWRPIAATLEDDYDILAPDQRGHGGSRIPHVAGARTRPTYTPLDYGKDVVELMDRLAFHPAWVIGHSMGVRTACAVAHLRPDWVRGLVLVDLGFSGMAGGGLGEGLAEFLRLLPARFATREEARAFMSAHCPDPSIAQYLMAVSVRAADGSVSFPFDQGALIETIHAARDASVRTWVRELAARGMPVLVLRGERSLVWSHEEYEAERAGLADLASVEFREVPGAGHGLPFEQRPEFVRIMREFVGS